MASTNQLTSKKAKNSSLGSANGQKRRPKDNSQSAAQYASTYSKGKIQEWISEAFNSNLLTEMDNTTGTALQNCRISETSHLKRLNQKIASEVPVTKQNVASKAPIAEEEVELSGVSDTVAEEERQKRWKPSSLSAEQPENKWNKYGRLQAVKKRTNVAKEKLRNSSSNSSANTLTASDTQNSQEEKLSRTIFVGNLPLLKTKPKDLYKLLNLRPSEVESIRFRSMPTHPKFHKNIRSGILSRHFADSSSTHNAYIVLKDGDIVPELLKKNGAIYRDHTLRLDAAEHGSRFSTFDPKRSLFVGNLPVSATEEQLREAFATMGRIKGLRIIRDRATSHSKGFGFIFFEDRLDVLKVLQSTEPYKVQGRTLRLTRALTEEKAKLSRRQSDGRMKKPSGGILKLAKSKFSKKMLKNSPVNKLNEILKTRKSERPPKNTTKQHSMRRNRR